MTFVDLFAGIGGVSLGLERAGHECVGQVEINEYCTRVLEKHWPNVPRHGDVRTFQGHEFGPFDLLTGGYPCQPFSNAGHRAGEDDPRHLWPEVLRIIRNVRPRLVLLENVRGHLSRGFGQVLGDLAESGYDAEWACISAADVGALHLRERVFILAYPDHERLQRSDDSKSIKGVETPWNESARGGAVGCGRGLPVAAPTGDSDRVRGRRYADGDLRGVLGAAPRRLEWPAEPDVGRVASGVPNRVDRLKALGNAVIPAVAQHIGERLAAEERADRGERR